MNIRDWLTEPRAGRGVRFAADDGGWESHSYAELALAARRSGAAMVEAGARRGDVVCLLMPTSYPTLCAFFGAWAAGLTPCMITPPSFTSTAEYVELVAGIVRQARPALLVTDEKYAEVAAQVGVPYLHREADEPIDVPPVADDDLAILQFTSGSTGTPRGIPVSWRNLAVNIASSRAWCGWTDGDSCASWLPLYHDMGLIGTLLVTICSQGDMSLMRPAQFLRDPARWLECMTTAAVTAAPPFALEYAAARIPAERIATWNFEGWRTLFVGAQIVDPAVLDRFATTFAPAGFDPAALRPAYGMAETTLGVTGTVPGTRPLVVQPEPDTLRFGRPVKLESQFRLGERPVPARSGWLTGCGTPRFDTAVGIVDEDGSALPDDYLGEIVVSGATLTGGYLGDAGASGTRFAPGRLHTGDAGFRHDGELFVLGRMGDSLKVNGRAVYVEDLEAAVIEATGLPASRCVVVSAPETDRAGVALFVEGRGGEWETAARDVLRARLGPGARLRFVLGRPGLIKRTTSGKPRRRALWQQLQDGAAETIEVS
ncbi:AMP-binding protein [Actinoplanes sp. NPDC026619]|uniref:AMP-binding protein n=1 Tax=Actinoplanes sp. NPDC026619 TaxID=3155798 RepID=UPI0033CA4A79